MWPAWDPLQQGRSATLLIVLGQKNWFFDDAPKGWELQRHPLLSGGNRKGQRDRAQAYFEFLFERFPAAQTTEDMRATLPQHEGKSLLPGLPKPKPRKK